MPEEVIIYECWISNQRDSFNKLRSDNIFGVIRWLVDAIGKLKPNDHLNIVAHHESEYHH